MIRKPVVSESLKQSAITLECKHAEVDGIKYIVPVMGGTGLRIRICSTCLAMIKAEGFAVV
jgi:hypothetical protein